MVVQRFAQWAGVHLIIGRTEEDLGASAGIDLSKMDA
jgi:hypothetical protein